MIVKRSMKTLAMIAALAMCLLLTGCYVPPDDVNNTGSSTVNNYPFLTDTPAPSEIVVNPPDDVNNTGNQNIFNNNQGSGSGNIQTVTGTAGPTPAASPDSSDWGQFGIPTGVSIQVGGATGSPNPDGTISMSSTLRCNCVTPSAEAMMSNCMCIPPGSRRNGTGKDGISSSRNTIWPHCRLKGLTKWSASALSISPACCPPSNRTTRSGCSVPQTGA